LSNGNLAATLQYKNDHQSKIGFSNVNKTDAQNVKHDCVPGRQPK